MAITPSIVRATAVLLLCAAVGTAHAGKRAKSAAGKSARPAVACAGSSCCAAASTTAKSVAAPIATPGFAGMVVGLDAETGAFGPASQKQLLELTAMEQEMISRSDEGLVEYPLTGGGYGLDLRGRFQEFVIVTIGRDGKPVFHCLDDASRVKRAPSLPATPVWEDR